MTRRETYLDWNATAPPRPEAVAAVAAALAHGGNPSSVHRCGPRRAATDRAGARGGGGPGRRATGRRDLRQRRHRGQSSRAARQRPRPPLVSAVEHDSVLQAAPGPSASRSIANGIVDLAALDAMLRPIRARRWSRSCWRTTRPESCSRPPDRRDRARARRAVPLRRGAGRRQNSARCRRDRRRSGQPVGAQARRPAGHRRARRDRRRRVDPLLRGGGQERGRRAGTENLPGIAGFAAAAEAAPPGSPSTTGCAGCAIGSKRRRWTRCRKRVVIGAAAPRLPNTTALALPGIAAETQVIALDLDGVMVSAGAACSSGKVGPSHVLSAMGCRPPSPAARSASAWAGPRPRPISIIFSMPGPRWPRRAIPRAAWVAA